MGIGRCIRGYVLAVGFVVVGVAGGEEEGAVVGGGVADEEDAYVYRYWLISTSAF